VDLSVLSVGLTLLPGWFLVLISVIGWVNLRAIVWLEGLGQLKKIQWPHRDLNPRPFGLYHRTLTTMLRHGPNRKRCFQKFFVAAGTSLPSCCLVTIGRYSLSSPCQATIGGIHIQTHRLMAGIYEVAVQMVSGAVIHTPSFVNLVQAVKSWWRDTHTR
jgi:hypothetical protein